MPSKCLWSDAGARFYCWGYDLLNFGHCSSYVANVTVRGVTYEGRGFGDAYPEWGIGDSYNAPGGGMLDDGTFLFGKGAADYLRAVAEAGWTSLPYLDELGVTAEHLALDPAFFGPLKGMPLHLLFELKR